MMQAMPAAGPARRLAASDVLAGHPPARHFLGLLRIAQIVDHQDVADVTLHLGRDVGVARVHVEAVDADAAGLVIADELRLRRLGDVVDLEAPIVIAALLELLEHAQVVRRHAHPGGDFLRFRLAPELLAQRAPRRRQLLGAASDLAHVALVIDDQDVAHDARLVAVGFVVVERDGRHHARVLRVRDVDDRGAALLGVRDMPDIGVRARQADLAGARQIEVAEAADIAGERRSLSFDLAHVEPRFSGVMRRLASTETDTRRPLRYSDYPAAQIAEIQCAKRRHPARGQTA